MTDLFSCNRFAAAVANAGAAAVIVTGEIYNLPVNLFNFPVKQEKRCINPPLRAGDRVRVRVRVS